MVKETTDDNYSNDRLTKVKETNDEDFVEFIPFYF